MSIPPCYADLGKKSRDLFSKGYNYGLFKLETKTKTDNGVQFTVNGNSNSDTGKVFGSLETKYKLSDYGTTFTEKWTTDNVLNSEMKIEDQLVKGLKLAFDTSFAPNTGKKSAKIKTAYKADYVHLNCDVDFDFAGPTVHGAAVLGYQGWMAGYQMTFDTSKSKLTRNNFSVGYEQGDFTLNTSVNDGSEFAGSVYQKVNNKLQTGVNLTWTAGSNSTRFGLAAKYALDDDMTMLTKVNNSGQVGLGGTIKVRDGVSISGSFLIDAKNFNAGGHKVGLGLEFEA